MAIIAGRDGQPVATCRGGDVAILDGQRPAGLVQLPLLFRPDVRDGDVEPVNPPMHGVYEASQAVLAQVPNVADAVQRQSEAIDRVSTLLSNRLMTYRITGTIRQPFANVDRSINARAAIGFFLKAMRLSRRSR